MDANSILALPLGKHKITDGNYVNTIEVKTCDTTGETLYFVKPQFGSCILLSLHESCVIKACAGDGGVMVHGVTDLSNFKLIRSYAKKKGHSQKIS